MTLNKFELAKLKACFANQRLDEYKELIKVLEKRAGQAAQDVRNMATDLWGGAGPDCKLVRLMAA